MSSLDDCWHAYYTCSKCKTTYGIVNISKGERRPCKNQECGEMNSPTNEVRIYSSEEYKMRWTSSMYLEFGILNFKFFDFPNRFSHFSVIFVCPAAPKPLISPKFYMLWSRKKKTNKRLLFVLSSDELMSSYKTCWRRDVHNLIIDALLIPTVIQQPKWALNKHRYCNMIAYFTFHFFALYSPSFLVL